MNPGVAFMATRSISESDSWLVSRPRSRDSNRTLQSKSGLKRQSWSWFSKTIKFFRPVRRPGLSSQSSSPRSTILYPPKRTVSFPPQRTISYPPKRTVSFPPQRTISFLDLPDNAIQKIASNLVDTDRRSLTLVSRGTLRSIEQTFENAPMFVFAGYDRNHGSTRVIPAYFPTVIPMHEIRLRREHSEGEKLLWLCPHTGCTRDDLDRISKSEIMVLPGIRDLIDASCSFPKCALWARHALCSTFGNYYTNDIRSVFKVYRLRSFDVSSSRMLLIAGLPQDWLSHAMSYLKMPLCSHLNLGSDQVVAAYNSRLISIIDTSFDSLRYWDKQDFGRSLDIGACYDCAKAGSRTTWGFFARNIAVDGELWLEVEIAVCRASGSSSEYSKPHGSSWDLHAIDREQLAKFNEGWSRWAKVVSCNGFDWRKPLPSRYLQQQRIATSNFSEQPPPYSSIFQGPEC